jgi:hypothetical protein
MKNDGRLDQLPPPEGSEDRPDEFISVPFLAFVIIAPLIYFGPQLGAVEAWLVDIYLAIDGWVAPIREFLSSMSTVGE